MKSRKKSRNSFFMLLLFLLLLCVIAGILLIWRKKNIETAPVQHLETELYSETELETETETETQTETQTETESEAETETESETLPAGTVTDMTLSFYHVFLHVSDNAVMPVVRMNPPDALNLSEVWVSSDNNIASVDENGHITPVSAGECRITAISVSNPNVSAEIQVRILPDEEPLPDPQTVSCSGSPRDDIYVIGGVTYVNGIMIVNKTYPLPADYNPQGMTPVTKEAFSQLCQAAQDEAGLYLFSHSDFRSYETQVYLYQEYADQYGSEAADTFSARAGYSEHQTGMVIDVNWPGDAFNDTPEAVWLEQNCARFGFIIRFPREKESLTGYKYESWHIRYVGQEVAQEIMQNKLCLEEYLHVTSEYP